MSRYSLNDLIFFPLYVLLFYAAIRSFFRSRHLDKYDRRNLMIGFWLRVFYCILYFLILQFYYQAGDSFGYYTAIEDLYNIEWHDKSKFLMHPTYVVTGSSDVLFYQFSSYLGITMENLSNAMVVKIGYWFSLLCRNSYLTISLFFTMFAYIGCSSLYKLFQKYYPSLRGELALAFLFLPSVCFWSSALLKDSLTLGAVCLLIYGIHNLLITRSRFFQSFLISGISLFMLFYIKVYILLAVIPGFIIWLFLKFNFREFDRNARGIIRVLFFIIGIGIGFFLLRYITSETYSRELTTEDISQTIYGARDVYGASEVSKGGSYFEIGTRNIFLSFPLGIVASLFRPFPWEVRSFTMFFSSIEAFGFLILTLYLLFKIGIFRFFKYIFSNAETIFFFFFSIIFAGSVGSSTANFGSLVRYKIPCLPFYLMLLCMIFYQANISYPRWLRQLTGKRYHRRVYQKISPT